MYMEGYLLEEVSSLNKYPYLEGLVTSGRKILHSPKKTFLSRKHFASMNYTIWHLIFFFFFTISYDQSREINPIIEGGD